MYILGLGTQNRYQIDQRNILLSDYIIEEKMDESKKVEKWSKDKILGNFDQYLRFLGIFDHFLPL